MYMKMRMVDFFIYIYFISYLMLQLILCVDLGSSIKIIIRFIDIKDFIFIYSIFFLYPYIINIVIVYFC